MLSQKMLLGILAGTARQKSFRVIDSRGEEGAVVAINITMVPNSQAADPANPGAPDVVGWTISVSYENAPDIELFTKTFPTEKQAQMVMDDLSQATAEVEGLIKQQKFEEASQKTTDLEKMFTANSTEQDVPTKEEEK